MLYNFENIFVFFYDTKTLDIFVFFSFISKKNVDKNGFTQSKRFKFYFLIGSS